jgi:CRISPR-associated protein Cas2
MLYLISYDLPSTPGGDRRRTRVAKILSAVGLRVQYSCFELDLPPERLGHVLQQIENVIDPLVDSCRVYPLCATCAAKTVRFGAPAPCEHGLLMEF